MEIYLFLPIFQPHQDQELLIFCKTRRRLLKSLYDEFENAYQENHLVRLIKRHRPEVIVDCVNTATGLSYQDVFDGAAKVREWIKDDNFDAKGIPDLETFVTKSNNSSINTSCPICYIEQQQNIKQDCTSR